MLPEHPTPEDMSVRLLQKRNTELQEENEELRRKNAELSTVLRTSRPNLSEKEIAQIVAVANVENRDNEMRRYVANNPDLFNVKPNDFYGDYNLKDLKNIFMRAFNFPRSLKSIISLRLGFLIRSICDNHDREDRDTLLNLIKAEVPDPEGFENFFKTALDKYPEQNPKQNPKTNITPQDKNNIILKIIPDFYIFLREAYSESLKK